jgi:hypothetical protein
MPTTGRAERPKPPDEVTVAINRVVAAVNGVDPFVEQAALRTLGRAEWQSRTRLTHQWPGEPRSL